jgi:hypothetical protein
MLDQTIGYQGNNGGHEELIEKKEVAWLWLKPDANLRSSASEHEGV